MPSVAASPIEEDSMSAERKNPVFELLGKLGSQPAEAMKTWEAWLGERFEQLARNESFLGQVGKAMERSFMFKAQMDRMTEETLHTMRLPTRGDVQAIHGRLDELERMIDRLTAGLAAAEAQSASLVVELEDFAARNTELADRLEAALAKPGEAA